MTVHDKRMALLRSQHQKIVDSAMGKPTVRRTGNDRTLVALRKYRSRKP